MVHCKKTAGWFGILLAAACIFGGNDRSVAEDRWARSISSQMTLRLATGTRSLPTHLDVVASNSGQTTTIDLRVLIDLSPLQTNSQGLLNVPDDNCRNYSASNFVLSIAEASLNADGNRLTLNASGKFDRWACVENPVPGTKVEWQIKDVGLGIKTKIPVVVTSPGSPIKTVLGSGNFALSSIFELSLVNSEAIDLKANILFNGVADEALKKMLEPSISDFTTALRNIIDLRSVLGLLPMQLRQLGFRPNAAKFSLQEGKLIAVLDFTAAISDSQSSAIRDALP